MENTLQMMLTDDLVYAALREVMDPELGLNIVDLGLIYDVNIGQEGRIAIEMTLTTPGCPLHASFREEIERTLWRSFPDLQGVSVALVWDPPWTPEMISPEGRAELGLF